MPGDKKWSRFDANSGPKIDWLNPASADTDRETEIRYYGSFYSDR